MRGFSGGGKRAAELFPSLTTRWVQAENGNSASESIMKIASLVLSAVSAAAACSTFAQSETFDNSMSPRQAAAIDRIQNLVAVAFVSAESAKPFKVVAPGIVKDTRTSLQWMRCSLGLDWDTGTKKCAGNAATRYTWEQAHVAAQALNNGGGYAGNTDWRLPTIRELQSLRFCSNGFLDSPAIDIGDGQGQVQAACAFESSSPAIAQTVFPDMLETDLSAWSSSATGTASGFAWLVLFSHGRVIGARHKEEFTVRLVR